MRSFDANFYSRNKGFEESMIDLLFVADEAGCTSRDVEKLIDAVVKMFTNGGFEVRYTCVSGRRIVVRRKNRSFEIRIE